MVDAYFPALSDLVLTNDEVDAIEKALQHSQPWDHEHPDLKTISAHLISAKQKLIDHHMQRHNQTCCYCRSPMGGGGRFVRDREHILPKGRYRALSYTPSNLAGSCKRCNMEYKGEKVSFVADPDTILEAHEDSDRYLIIHPNFDRYEQHILRRSKQEGMDYIVAYSVRTGDPKAEFTFNFFGLDKLEKESFDEVQGLRWGNDPEVEREEDFPERI